MNHHAFVRRRIAGALAGTASILALGSGSRLHAAAWPERPVQLIAPVPPGGGVDAVVRRLGDRLGDVTRGRFVTVNRPGAAGLIGATSLSAASPDGHTFGYLHAGHLVLQATSGKPDLIADFAPVIRISSSSFAIAVKADAPYRSLEDLLRALRDKPGDLNYGAGGPGSPGHIAFEKLASMRGGLVAVQVPYKGAVEAVTALAQGDIDFVSGVLSSTLPLVRGGRVRLLAVTSAKRSSQMPEVPTVAEAASLPDYVFDSWGGLFGPAKTPSAVVAQLEDAVRRAVDDAGYRQFVEESGSEISLSESPEWLAAFLRRELADTAALMKKLGLRKI